MSQALHPLDRATALQWRDGFCEGHTDEAYWNFVGPFGGYTAATVLRAVLEHPQRQGDPVSFTVNFALPLSEGAFTIRPRPVQTGRSTQHWNIELEQDPARGTAINAIALLAARRPTWEATEAVMPTVPAAESLERFDVSGLTRWPLSYDMRFVRGAVRLRDVANGEPAPASDDSLTQVWMRDEPGRPLDYVSLTALCDAFFPRLFLRRPRWVPLGTVSMNIYFHATTEELAEVGDRHILCVAQAARFHAAFSDQLSSVWSPSGRLLATTQQLVWYKE